MTGPANRFRLALLLAVCTMMAGCSALSVLGGAARPLGIYELRAPDLPDAATRTLPLEVVIELPSASGTLATERILIRPSAFQAQYLPGVRWSDQTPELLQTLMVRTLLNTGRFRSVGRRPLGASGDFAVLTELTDFQAETPGDGAGPALIRLALVATLVREQDASVVAVRRFTSTAESASTDDEDLIPAFALASDRLLIDFATWVTGTLARSS